MKLLLSIVVPTKNRYYYLKQLILLIDSYNLSEYELVIQDNSDQNEEILDFLSKNNFHNIKYYYQQGQISQSANSDLAILHSIGEYVCFIGDDDGVLENIIDCTKWMKNNNIDALRPALTVYNWPDYYFDDRKMGTLLYENINYDFNLINPIKSLKKLAKTGFTHIYSLPKVYQGIVKRDILDKLFEIGGTFSPGPSPDMATAVALSFIVKTFIITHLPVIIIGQSKNVGGGERQLKGGVMKIEDVPFLPKDSKEKWNKRIPRVWCSQTVWPESAIKGIEYMKKSQEIQVNYEYILAEFIRTHKIEKEQALQLSKNRLRLAFHLNYFKLRRLVNAINWRLKYLFTGNKVIHGFQNIKEDLTNIQDVNVFLKTRFAKFLYSQSYKKLEFHNKLN